MSQQVEHLEDHNFDEAIKEGVTLVDFFADWCGPCKVIAPVIEELATELNGKAKIAKVDVGRAEKTTISYGITAVPTLIIFKNGQEVKRFSGITMKNQLRSAIEQVL